MMTVKSTAVYRNDKGTMTFELKCASRDGFRETVVLSKKDLAVILKVAASEFDITVTDKK